jgi:hypothetical protein
MTTTAGSGEMSGATAIMKAEKSGGNAGSLKEC